MHETSLRVMNMVRRTLLETPDVTDRALYAAAIALEPSIGTLSLKQFQARYPRRVRRLEIGPRTRRSRESTTSPDERPISDRPNLYAPGEDTLVSRSSVGHTSEAGFGMDGDATIPASRSRRVRRDIGGLTAPAGGSPSDDEPKGSRGPEAAAGREAAAMTTGSEPSASTPTSEPAQPWPLRLHPEAADRLPAQHLRLVRAEGDRAGAVKTRRKQRNMTSASWRSSVEDSSAELNARSAREASTRISTPSHPQQASNSRESLAGKRTGIRSVLFAWAREIAEAETRGQLVAVLARANDYANRITRIIDTDGGNTGSFSPRGAQSVSGETRGTPTVPRQLERPNVSHRRRIEQYDPADLDAVVRWVAQTEPELGPEDIVARVCQELGFQRRGRQIVAGIRTAVERVLAAGT